MAGLRANGVNYIGGAEHYTRTSIDFVNQYTFSNQYDFYEEKYIEIKK